MDDWREAAIRRLRARRGFRQHLKLWVMPSALCYGGTLALPSGPHMVSSMLMESGP